MRRWIVLLVVSFERPQSDTQMTEWASNINDVLELVEKTRHLIDRENQVGDGRQFFFVFKFKIYTRNLFSN